MASQGGSRGNEGLRSPQGVLDYYICIQRRKLGKICSCTQSSLQATEIEPTVWAFVSDLLTEPEKIRVGMETLNTFQTTKRPKLQFRALLTENGLEIELVR